MSARASTPTTREQAAVSGRPGHPSTTTNPPRAAQEQALSRFDSDFRRIFGEPKK